MQTLAEQFGGQVSSSKNKEFGHAQILLEKLPSYFLMVLAQDHQLMFG
jgi:GMP synthase-like glutamine amidotransferase